MKKNDYISAKAHGNWLRRGGQKQKKRVLHNGVTYPSIRKFAWEVCKKEANYIHNRVKNHNCTLPDGSTFEILD